MTVSADWYPDPENPGQLRYWDGMQWTEHRAPGGTASTDQVPMDAPPPPKKKSTALLIGLGACGALFVLALIVGALAGPSEKESVVTKSTDKSTTTEARTTTPPTTKAPTTTAPPTTEAPTTTTPPTTAPPTTQDPYAGESVSQRNARQSAADYLDYTAFSRSGLIEQLEYEGFTQADAAYAVDSLNVDWNEQAAKSAADYLDYTSFSHSGLVDQLVYEGFTYEQAEYGVSTTGL